jgi:hypothetical protein
MPQSSSPPATGAVRLGDTSDVDGSERALSNPERHTFGLPVVGGAGSLLPRRAGVRAHTLEGDPGRSSVSLSSSSSAAAAAVAAAMSTCARSARGQVASPEPGSSSSRARSSNSLPSERERQGSRLQSIHSFGSQGSKQQQQQQQEEETPPSPSILSQSVQSEEHYEWGVDDNTDGDARTGDVRSIFTGTDAGPYSSRSTNSFLAFASTSTIFFTISVRGLEHGADIVRDSVAYDR